MHSSDLETTSEVSPHAGLSKTTPVSCQLEPEEPHTIYLSGFKLWAALTGVTLVSFIMLLDMTIIATAVPQITDEFHSLPDIGWYGSAYTLASAALQPMAGKLYSHLSTKWTFATFIAVLEVGSLVCGFARSSAVFIVGRAVAGLGASGIMNGALTIIAVSVPLARRPAITGIVIGLAYVGSVAGPLIGGALTEYATWRWCFWINLPIGGVACVVLLVTSIPKHSSKRVCFYDLLSILDLPGFILLASAVIMILLALHYGSLQYPWDSAVVTGLLCGGSFTTVAFMIWERWRKERAMMPLSLLSRRVVWSSSLVAGFMTSALLVHSYYLPIYFQAVRNVSPSLSGVYILPSILSQLVSSVLSGLFVSRNGYCLPIVLLSGVMVAIGGGILSLLDPETPTAKWVGYQVLLGFGRGFGIQIPTIAVQAVLEPDLVPIGMSLIVFSQTFGGSVFLTVANVVFNNKLKVSIAQLAPEVSADRVIGAGATAFRSVVPEGYVWQVLEAYSRALSAVFYLSAALAVVYFAFSWGIGWTDVRNKEAKVQIKGALT
ncbi:efflux pump [Biscogniauxia sp. FL1348]|nr:efflux pump [Biscogniauxia sp. FL1348]KAI0595689.1 efflux pump [Biscogniauxia sp. FL1348]